MYALNLFRGGVLVCLCSSAIGAQSVLLDDSLQKPPTELDYAANEHASLKTGTTRTVDHYDPVEIDTSLTLSAIVDATLAKYPDSHWLDALEQEARTIAQRGESWLAGAASASLATQGAFRGVLYDSQALVQVPLWNFGQRDAEQNLARQAGASAQAQAADVKLRVAGLVRAALWDMALQNSRFEQAQTEVTITEQLMVKIRRMYELGDLPRADLLLAQTELLQKRSLQVLAEAEVMHARKRYISITQSTKIPADYREKLIEMAEIEPHHPTLVAMNNQIARKRAEITAIEMTGSGQTNLLVGISSERGTDSRSNETESFNIGVSVPFGGRAHLAPHIAAAQVELSKLIAQREQLFRDLEIAHHEAEHNLEVNRVELERAEELKQLAEEHFKMTQLSFSVGEINLMDLLKVQARTQQARLNAKERAVLLQRDIALHNQAVGVLP
ncbi:MAG: hypothetical protein CVV13_04040 [Gammaproteobacteria bacterium HGW-Gammaproteobacteria-3]|jgi:outer membrane protein TolC|nr:MAG: hypothetical protein CVV13_04040 [Gammaproteobacteria bacterium HGW-Gammaproteobacteria-3]